MQNFIPVDTDNVEIPLSKPKLSLILIGALGFVALGFWMALSPSTFSGPFSFKHIVVIVIGYSSIVFFGLCAVSAFFKLKANKPGFVIDNEGITDNSGGVSVGFIPWTSITAINTASALQQNFIMIHVKNPEKVIQTQSNFLKKAALWLNNKTYGTPISVSSNGLKCSYQELCSLLSTKLKEYNPGA